MRVTTSYLLNNLTRDISEQLARMQKLSEEISSGKRVRKPSDDPQAASRALAIRALKSGVARHRANAADARDWLAATEGALMRTHDVLERAADVALRASSGSYSDQERGVFAKEVGDLISELLSLANTEHDGRYAFAGLRTTTLPFSLIADPADPGYPATYHGMDGAKELEVEPGTLIQVNTSGGEVFMKGIASAGDRNVFEILSNLREHLLAGGSSPTFQADIALDIEGVHAAADEVMNFVTGIGAKIRRIDRVCEKLSRDEVELKALLSRTEDADVVRAVTELQLQEAVYKAALGAAARVMQPSLLDYLR